MMIIITVLYRKFRNCQSIIRQFRVRDYLSQAKHYSFVTYMYIVTSNVVDQNAGGGPQKNDTKQTGFCVHCAFHRAMSIHGI